MFSGRFYARSTPGARVLHVVVAALVVIGTLLGGVARPVAAAGWGAVLGWYSLIHLAASELPGAVAALARPLAPGALLVLGLHAGDDVRRVRGLG